MRSVELFAGCGGLALGAHQAGFVHDSLVEWNARCCETLRANQAADHPMMRGVGVIEGDVRDVDWSRFADRVDLLSGGPPCQPFSAGGKGLAAGDPRDMFPAAVEAIRTIRPNVFVIENVRGFTRARFADYYAYIQARLARPEIVPREGESWSEHHQRLRKEQSRPNHGLGYEVTASLVDAADYGVPQHRWRVFMVGFRNDIGADRWSFPAPTHSGDALARIKQSGEYWDRHRVPVSDRPAPGTALRGDGDGLLAWRTVRDALNGMPEPTTGGDGMWADHVLREGARAYPGHTGSEWDGPAKTLKAGSHGVPGGENMLDKGDGTVRYFTAREAARLQTFPDDWVLVGPWGEQMRQLGNAVPVGLARAVVVSVHEHLIRSGRAPVWA